MNKNFKNFIFICFVIFVSALLFKSCEKTSGDLSSLLAKQANLEQQLKTYQAILSKLKRGGADEDDIEDLEEEIEDLEEDIEDLKEEIEDLKNSNSGGSNTSTSTGGSNTNSSSTSTTGGTGGSGTNSSSTSTTGGTGGSGTNSSSTSTTGGTGGSGTNSSSTSTTGGTGGGTNSSTTTSTTGGSGGKHYCIFNPYHRRQRPDWPHWEYKYICFNEDDYSTEIPCCYINKESNRPCPKECPSNSYFCYCGGSVRTTCTCRDDTTMPVKLKTIWDDHLIDQI